MLSPFLEIPKQDALSEKTTHSRFNRGYSSEPPVSGFLLVSVATKSSRALGDPTGKGKTMAKEITA